MDVAALTRAKLAPMVGGLFPQGERAAVLDALSRSTFEAYSRILTLGKGPAGRRMRLFELEQRPMPADERVDAAEYVDVLREAVEARNGWKRILDRCSNQRPVRRREQQAERSL